MSRPEREKLLEFLDSAAKMGGSFGDDAAMYAAQIRREYIKIGAPKESTIDLRLHIHDLESHISRLEERHETSRTRYWAVELITRLSSPSIIRRLLKLQSFASQNHLASINFLGESMSAIHALCDAILADPKLARHHKLAEEAKADARPTMRNTYMVTEGSKKPYETKDVDAVAALMGLSTNSFRVYLSTNGGTLSRNGVKVERKKA